MCQQREQAEAHTGRVWATGAPVPLAAAQQNGLLVGTQKLAGNVTLAASEGHSSACSCFSWHPATALPIGSCSCHLYPTISTVSSLQAEGWDSATAMHKSPWGSRWQVIICH